MARPRRPDAERALVREAATGDGCASERAARLAGRVAAQALAHIDAVEVEPVLVLLRDLALDPVHALATDPEIDTGRLIRAERTARMEARGGRRLREREWPAEDAAVLQSAAKALHRRYRAMLTPRK